MIAYIFIGLLFVAVGVILNFIGKAPIYQMLFCGFLFVGIIIIFMSFIGIAIIAEINKLKKSILEGENKTEGAEPEVEKTVLITKT